MIFFGDFLRITEIESVHFFFYFPKISGVGNRGNHIFDLWKYLNIHVIFNEIFVRMSVEIKARKFKIVILSLFQLPATFHHRKSAEYLHFCNYFCILQ